MISVFTLAESAGLGTASWQVILIVLAALFSAVTAISGVVMAINSRNQSEKFQQIWDRFEKGERQFETLHKRYAEVAVQHAMDTGELRVLMQREFVTREEYNRRNERYDEISDRLTRLTTLVEQWMERDQS